MTPVRTGRVTPSVPDHLPTRPWAPRWLLVVLAVAFVVGGGVLVIASHRPAANLRPLPDNSAGAAAPPSAPGDTRVQPVLATNSGPFTAGPAAPPASGALFGAWVRPQVLTQQRRVAAVQALESTLGRRLDIVATYRRFDDPFPTQSDRAFAAAGSTLMLSWVIDDTRVISSGALDNRLRDWARRIRDLNGAVMLRLRWEMDRPGLAASMGSGRDYIAAWRHVRSVFAQQQVDNVSWVWCPTAEGFAGGYAQAFYPGDDQVDWTCADVYASSTVRPLGDLLRPFLTWAAAHPKPIVIGEFGVDNAWGPANQVAWLADAALLIQANPQIKAVCYFDADPEGNGQPYRYELTGEPLSALARMVRRPYFNPNNR